VAWVQRDGPGTTCARIPPAGLRCDQHLNPLPWLVIGLALLVAGVVAHARRGWDDSYAGAGIRVVGPVGPPRENRGMFPGRAWSAGRAGL